MTQEPTLRLLRWGNDKFNTGYRIFTFFFCKRFDMYLFHYTEGSLIPKHKDPSFGYRHYRFNIVLKQPQLGGIFKCKNCIFSYHNRIHLFRADTSFHSVSRIEKGERWLLSFGFRI